MKPANDLTDRTWLELCSMEDAAKALENTAMVKLGLFDTYSPEQFYLKLGVKNKEEKKEFLKPYIDEYTKSISIVHLLQKEKKRRLLNLLPD